MPTVDIPPTTSERAVFILQLLGANVISHTEARNALGIEGDAPGSSPDESHVEIGGQRMTEAQFHAARQPLLDGVASATEAKRLREVWGYPEPF